MKTLPLTIREDVTCPPEVALCFVAEAAAGVQRLHYQGKWHGAISVQSVSFWENQPVALAPADRPRCFGGRERNDDLCPPLLRRGQPIELPGEIASAQALLQQSRLEISPTQIDLYQLTTLLNRLVTGEPISAYLRSPKTKAKVPPALQTLIDRALGYVEQDRIRDIEGLLDAVHVLYEQRVFQRRSANPLPSSIETPLFLDPASNAADTDLTPSQPGKEPEEELVPMEITPDQLPFLTLGHYEIRSRLGHGGMGDVYEGYERILDRMVAIKVLPDELARHDEYVRRFYSEASAAAKLVHPNIVEIYYIGQDQGRHYFAMQFVDGGSLAQLLRETPRLPVDEALSIIEQVLSGLALAHRKGLVHRDIKPGNILLDRNRERAYLADFGLVKAMQLGTGLTATGVVLGTAEYVSPEQGRGSAIDQRSDLYSVGVLAYQLLCGRLPFTGDSATSLIFQHVYEQPADLRQHCSEIPPELSGIVAKLMAKDPADRYNSGEAVLADLRAFRLGEPLPSRANHPTSSVPDSGVSESALESHDRASFDQSLFAPSLVVQAPRFEGEAVLPSESTESPPWWLRLRDWLIGLAGPRAQEAFERLQSTQVQVDGAVGEYERRNERLQALLADAGSVLHQLEQQRDGWHEAARNVRDRHKPGASEVLAVNEQADPARYEQIADELNARIAEQRRQMESMRLDAAKVAATLERLRSQRDILNARMKVAEARLRLVGGTKRGLNEVPRRLVGRRGWLLSVPVVVFSVLLGIFLWKKPMSDNVSSPSINRPSAQTRVREVPVLPHAKVLINFTAVDKPVAAATFSPDGHTIAAAGEGGIAQLLDATTGNFIREFDCHARAVTSLAYSPDGRLLATGAIVENPNDEGLKFWDVSSGREILTESGRTGTVRNIEFSRQGERLLAMHVESDSQNIGTLKLWDATTGTQLKSFPNLPVESDFSINFDGTYIAISEVSSSEVRIIDLETGNTLYSEVLTDRPRGLMFVFDSQSAATDLAAITDRGLLIRSGALPFTRQMAFDGDPQESVGRRVSSFAFQPSRGGVGKLAIASGPIIRVYDRTTDQPLVFVGPSPPVSMDMHPSGELLVLGSKRSPYLTLVSASSDPKAKPVANPEFRQLTLGTESATAAMASSDGSTVLFGTEKSLRLVRSRDGANLAQFDDVSPLVSAVALSADGRTVAAGSADGAIQVWSVGGKKPTRRLSVQPGKTMQSAVSQLSLSHDGSLLLAAATAGTPARLWDLTSGKNRLEAIKEPLAVGVAFSPKADRFVVGGMDHQTGSGVAQIRDTVSGELLHNLTGHTIAVTRAAYSADGRHILTASNNEVLLWEAEPGTFLRQFPLPDDLHERSRWPLEIAFSLDGKFAAAMTNDHTLVWDARAGQQVLRLRRAGTGVFFADQHVPMLAVLEKNICYFWKIDAAK